jgi:HAD superfamily hydrolase (TIGR01509 family)
MTKGFVFDVDGTLVDSVDLHARAWQETLRRFGREVSFEEVRAQIGKGGDQLMPVFLPPEQVERRGEEISEYRDNLFRREYLGRVRPFPKVKELFERARFNGLRIALASSSPEDEVEHYIDLLDVGSLIHAYTSADDAARSKPFPDIFRAAISRLELRPQELVIFGDSPYDAEAAVRLGSPVIGLRCGGFAESDLRAAGCVAVYDDPADLLRDYTALEALAVRPAA